MVEKELSNDSRDEALRRLHFLLKRWTKNQQLLERYDKAIAQYTTDGHAEVVSVGGTNTQVYYEPHRGVLKKVSTTTKLKVVFDASSFAPGCLSLNECLDKGCHMSPEILEVLLKFRTYKIGLVADIQKVFLQIGVHPEDRDAFRFLWYSSKPKGDELQNQLRELLISRVPFGVTCSPFILSATILYHLKNTGGSRRKKAEVLLTSFYVEDLVVGAQSEEEAPVLHNDANVIMISTGMTLKKLSTNSKRLQATFNANEEQLAIVVGVEPILPRSPVKVLGLLWGEQDILQVSLNSVLENMKEEPPTKRSVLKTTAAIFDTLGMLSPFVIRAKIIFQTLWMQNITWDSALGGTSQDAWSRWCSELSILKDVQVARYLFPSNTAIPTNVQINVFTDASPHAYGAVVHVRTKLAKA